MERGKKHPQGDIKHYLPIAEGTLPEYKMIDKDGNNIESIEAMTTVSFKSLKVLNFSMG